MSGVPVLNTLEDLLAYSQAIEEEAAERYVELADMMEASNNLEMATFFKRMAEVEQKHIAHVRQLGDSGGRVAELRRSSLGAGEAPDWDEFHYLHRPYHAIQIALRFERRAADFFADVARNGQDEELRKMAARLADDEAGHVRELNELLKRHPAPPEDWDYDPDPVAEQ